MVFPSFTQLDAMDCGPTSLKIVAHHGGKDDLGTIAGEGDTSLYRTLEPTTFRSRL